jgi:hypothetical protein
MNTITIPTVAEVRPVTSVPTTGNAPSTTNSTPPQPVVVDHLDLSVQVSQQQDQPKIQYANPEVLGTTSFSLYKSADGELVTRIVDQKTGKVTYIPKEFPVLGGRTGGGGIQSVVNITA